MKQEDVQALVDQLFTTNKPKTAKASEFRVYYNDFGEIVSLAPKELDGTGWGKLYFFSPNNSIGFLF